MGAMGDSGGTELAISILQLLREMVRAIVRWRWQSFGVTGQAQGLPLRDCFGRLRLRFGWGTGQAQGLPLRGCFGRWQRRCGREMLWSVVSFQRRRCLGHKVDRGMSMVGHCQRYAWANPILGCTQDGKGRCENRLLRAIIPGNQMMPPRGGLGRQSCRERRAAHGKYSSSWRPHQWRRCAGHECGCAFGCACGAGAEG